MKKRFFLLLLLTAVLGPAQLGAQSKTSCCKAKVTDKDWYSENKKAPLFEGLEGINFPISTKSSEAQKYFNQGLMLSYAFNHAEAARSFYQAIRLDSSCAMCYWGYGLVLGPNYNAGMEKDNFQRAYAAAQKAVELSNSATQKEKMLILSLAMRYDSVPTDDRTWYDDAYSFSMGSVYQVFPDDPDVGSLYAEALMDQHPWNLWNADGSPKEWTPEIVQVLEGVLKKAPRHPGANHFYIHAVEASKTPQRAMASADLLRDLVPGAGHLVHMPSHIYIRTGRYHDGTIANKKAVAMDDQYISACHAQGVYPLAYFPHNYHFMAATATMEGDKETALMASMKMKEGVDVQLMRQPEWGTLQHYYSIPYYVMVKFGLWDELLKEEAPEADLPYPAAILHYAKGMASLAKMNFSKAEEHLNDLEKLASDSLARSLSIWGVNNAGDLMDIARHILKGEILNRKGNGEAAIAELKAAVSIEDKLNYNEPPDWFFSVRHHLGAVCLENKMYDDAIKAYQEDLEKYPDNGWSLTGLDQALQFKSMLDEAKKTELKLEKAWQYATVKINSSRIL